MAGAAKTAVGHDSVLSGSRVVQTSPLENRTEKIKGFSSEVYTFRDMAFCAVNEFMKSTLNPNLLGWAFCTWLARVELREVHSRLSVHLPTPCDFGSATYIVFVHTPVRLRLCSHHVIVTMYPPFDYFEHYRSWYVMGDSSLPYPDTDVLTQQQLEQTKQARCSL